MKAMYCVSTQRPLHTVTAPYPNYFERTRLTVIQLHPTWTFYRKPSIKQEKKVRYGYKGGIGLCVGAVKHAT